MKKTLILSLLLGSIVWSHNCKCKCEKILKNKNIVLIISFKDFKDEEYFLTRKNLVALGAKIKTASNKLGVARGVDGKKVKVDLLVSKIDPREFDAVIFIGGPGCLENLDNENSYKVVKETIKQNKVLGAICIAPVILAKSGVLEGKKATVWSSCANKEGIKILKEKGAIYQDKEVVTDGKIITANGPAATLKFSEAIINILREK